MKLFKTVRIKEIDAYTIQHEPIKSFDLMERASRVLLDKLLPFLEPEKKVCVFAGPGNNGGDALVVARYLLMLGQSVSVFLINIKKSLSPNCEEAKKRLNFHFQNAIVELEGTEDIDLSRYDYILDGLFGSGLTRPLDGFFSKIVAEINASKAMVFSVDIPSGLFGEDNRNNNQDSIIHADYTFTFQFPKISFLMPENEMFVGEYFVLDIGLHARILRDLDSPYFFTEEQDIKKMLHVRSKFAHKGTFGHAILIAGSYGKMGASVLASKACLRAGCGLLSVHIPEKGYEIMQVSVPEAMVDVDRDPEIFTSILLEEKYTAIGIGPGIGTEERTKQSFSVLLRQCRVPLVIDADALNILSSSPDLLKQLPSGSILTPHPKEFDRLFGCSSSGYERLQKQLDFSDRYGVIIVLKGANTSISFPDGRCFFNSTGNPGMATAGSGDVLTGIILSLLAQKYTSEQAAILGVYLHGMAGDFAAKKLSPESLLASDIIDALGDSFLYFSQISQ